MPASTSSGTAGRRPRRSFTVIISRRRSAEGEIRRAGRTVGSAFQRPPIGPWSDRSDQGPIGPSSDCCYPSPTFAPHFGGEIVRDFRRQGCPMFGAVLVAVLPVWFAPAGGPTPTLAGGPPGTVASP